MVNGIIYVYDTLYICILWYGIMNDTIYGMYDIWYIYDMVCYNVWYDIWYVWYMIYDTIYVIWCDIWYIW